MPSQKLQAEAKFTTVAVFPSIIIALGLLVLVLPLFQKGTFIDGMLYKTVAYNKTQNLASLWNMKFTNTCMKEFCEQPPLYFYTLGVYGRIFGNSLIADRVFTLLLFFGTLFFSIRVFSHFPRHKTLLTWFLLLFIFSIPVFSWSYANQVIEPMLCCLTAAAVLVFTRFINEKKVIYAVLFGVILVALFLTKGIQACFPATLPFFYWLFNLRDGKRIYFLVISVLMALVIPVSLFLFSQEARHWWSCYYERRLVLTMENIGATTDNRFEIVGRFLSELLILLLIIVALLLFLRSRIKYPYKTVLQNFKSNQLAFSLVLASLAGSLPYAVSYVQRGFYLLPAMLCFALAVCIGFKRYWLLATGRLKGIASIPIVRILSFSILSGACIYFIITVKDYKRDEALMGDIELIEKKLKPGSIVLIDGSLWNYYSLHANLFMRKEISLETEFHANQFMLYDKKSADTTFKSSYKKLELPTLKLDLYELNTR